MSDEVNLSPFIGDPGPCVVEFIDNNDETMPLLPTQLLINGFDIGPWVDPVVTVKTGENSETTTVELRIKPSHIVFRHR